LSTIITALDQMENNSTVGIISRIDSDYLYVWSSVHRAKEAKFPRFAETYAYHFMPGDVVRFTSIADINAVQDAKCIKKYENSGIKVSIADSEPWNFKVFVHFAIPPNPNFFQENSIAKVYGAKFLAFSVEFGKVVSFHDFDYSTGKVYTGYASRLSLEKSQANCFDTLFELTGQSINEITDIKRMELVKKRMPWKDVPVLTQNASVVEPININPISITKQQESLINLETSPLQVRINNTEQKQLSSSQKCFTRQLQNEHVNQTHPLGIDWDDDEIFVNHDWISEQESNHISSTDSSAPKVLNRTPDGNMNCYESNNQSSEGSTTGFKFFGSYLAYHLNEIAILGGRVEALRLQKKLNDMVLDCEMGLLNRSCQPSSSRPSVQQQ